MMLRLPPSKITLSAVEIQDFSARQRVRLHGTTQHSKSFEASFLKPQDLRAKNYGRGKSSENNVNEALNRLHGMQQASSTSTAYRGDASDVPQYARHLPREIAATRASQEVYGEHHQDWYHPSAASGSGQASHFRAEEFTFQVEDSQGENEVIDYALDEESSCEDDYEQSLSSDSSDHQENDHPFLPVSYDSTGDTENCPGRHGTKVHANSSSPSKHRFDYGGFVEGNNHDSSHFMPDDSSTPVPLIPSEVQRLRARLPLPRSPLHMSELVAMSPERKHGNTPRVSSYAAPSLLLAQPPRRIPKAYRPRTISYSYEESERASAAYEEPQLNNSDNDESQSDHVQHRKPMSLYEELRGSSLQSTLAGIIPSSPPAGPVIVRNEESDREFIFSSPHLSGELPPPFSTVPRGNSLATSIPSTLSHEGHRSDESVLFIGDHPSPPPRIECSEVGSAEPVSSSMLDRIGRMFSGRYKLRSVGSSPETSKTASSPITPRQSGENAGNLTHAPTATPRRVMRVYDDSLPPSSQPQTPANVPESRHRSRLHPSFTAPVARHRPGVLNTSPPSIVSIPNSVRRSRRTAGRSDSPMGMGGERGEGFRGLYGGQENTDEDTLFENAARRLFDSDMERLAMRESDGTPEREWTIADVRRENH